jgi:hypothetical protein
MNGLSPIEYLVRSLKGLALSPTVEDLQALLPLKHSLVH